jgi:hypothetical protein
VVLQWCNRIDCERVAPKLRAGALDERYQTSPINHLANRNIE